MERITISLDEDLARQFDEYSDAKGYNSRSEAIRDLIRDKLEGQRLESGQETSCIATLSYVFNHHERELARRLTQAQHNHHNLGIATLHTHLDHDNCLEVSILRGRSDSVQRFADSLMSQVGVRHGNLHLVPADVKMAEHDHGAADHEPHYHSHPKT